MDGIDIIIAASAYVKAVERYEEKTADAAGHASTANFVEMEKAHEEVNLWLAALKASVHARRRRAKAN